MAFLFGTSCTLLMVLCIILTKTKFSYLKHRKIHVFLIWLTLVCVVGAIVFSILDLVRN